LEEPLFGSEWRTANIEVKKCASKSAFDAMNSNEQRRSLHLVNFLQSQSIADAGVSSKC